jgi:hypothetical protein
MSSALISYCLDGLSALALRYVLQRLGLYASDRKAVDVRLARLEGELEALHKSIRRQTEQRP